MLARLQRLESSVTLDRPLRQVFPFFADPRNLERLTPDSLRFHILGDPGPAHAGQVIDYRLRVHGLPLRWRTLISRWDPPHAFTDVAVHSPYGFWHHEHRFQALGRRTRMTDTVLYALPCAPLGDWLAGALVRRDVEAIFAHRSRVVGTLFAAKPRTPRTGSR